MIHRDINVFSTLTSECTYTYTHTSLENVILINVTSQNIYLCCSLLMVFRLAYASASKSRASPLIDYFNKCLKGFASHITLQNPETSTSFPCIIQKHITLL